MVAASVHVPALGESVREARVVAILKAAGDYVMRDEPLVEVETDKAAYTIESPAEGVVGTWACAAGSVLDVGALLVEISPRVPNQIRSGRNAVISPRLRDKARQLGIPPERLEQLAADLGRPVVEADLDSRMERPGPRFAVSGAAPVPATIETSFRWTEVDSFRKRIRAQKQEVPSAVEWIAWNTLRAVERHPRFRSVPDGHTFRPQSRATVGVAIELPDDELGVAAVEERPGLDLPAFVAELRAAVAVVRQGGTVPVPPQIVVSSLAHLGVESAIPVIVPPSVGTIFIGAPRSGGGQEKRSKIALTFDHRLANGAAAARLLQSIVRGIESPQTWTSAAGA